MRKAFIFEITAPNGEIVGEYGAFDESMTDAMLRVGEYVKNISPILSIVCTKVCEAAEGKDLPLFGVKVVDQRKQKREERA